MQPRRMVIEVIGDDMAAFLRRKTPAERLAIVDRLLRGARSLVTANVEMNHPDWDAARVRQAVVERIAGGSH